MTSEYTQLGIAGLTLGILFFIVRYFVATLNSKDTYMIELVKNFQTHIELCNTNFMKNSTITSRALEKLTKVIAENTTVLKQNMRSGTENTISSEKNTTAVDKNTGAIETNGKH